MANSYTPNYQWELPEVGGSADNWGQVLNSSITSVDSTVNIIRTDLDNITKSAVTFAGSDTKAMTGPLILYADPPAKTTSGTDAGIKYAATRNYVDAQIAVVKAAAGLQLSGNLPTTPMTGPLYLQGDPVTTASSNIAATKGYVDTATAGVIKKDGTVSMTAALTLSADPTSPLHAATKQYIDRNFLSLSSTSSQTISQSITFANTLNVQSNTPGTNAVSLSSTGITSGVDITINNGSGGAGAGRIFIGNSGSWFYGSSTNIGWYNNNSSHLQWYSATGALSISGPSATLNVSGAIYSSGDITAFSDARLKYNIITINDATSLVKQLRGVRFNRKDTNAPSIGVIAQEVREIIPEVVHEKDGTFSVAYGNLVGVLIEAVKELSARVDELEAR